MSAGKRTRARKAASLQQLERTARLASSRYHKAITAVLEHPQTIARQAAKKAIDATLMEGCANALNEQIEDLEHAMQHARIRGDRMVVAKEVNAEAGMIQDRIAST